MLSILSLSLSQPLNYQNTIQASRKTNLNMVEFQILVLSSSITMHGSKARQASFREHKNVLRIWNVSGLTIFIEQCFVILFYLRSVFCVKILLLLIKWNSIQSARKLIWCLGKKQFFFNIWDHDRSGSNENIVAIGYSKNASFDQYKL